MDENEFNLSVLENANDFSCLLKNSADYENIIGLIKEEIDINTEDETELQTVGKRPYTATERKDCDGCDSDGVFKSPLKRKRLMSIRTPGTCGNGWRTRQSPRYERKTEVKVKRKARSLGAIKPGRTYQTRKNRSSASHTSENSSFSDFADTSVAATNNGTAESELDPDSRSVHDAAEEICNNALLRKNAIESSLAEEENATAIETGGAKEEERTGVESNENVPSPPGSDVDTSSPKSRSDDYVESSQSTRSSKLRRKLLKHHSEATKESTSKANNPSRDKSRNGLADSDEEEDLNFSLNFSPSSKSHASNAEASVTPPRLRKRKSSVPSTPLGSNSKQRKIDAYTRTVSRDHTVSATSSPLKVLKELENCMTNSDYEQMSDDLQNDMTNRASFTFETIELLNDYEYSNERANNPILSMIFSASNATVIKDEPSEAQDASNARQHPYEDPLYIEEKEARASMSKSRKKNSKVKRRSGDKSSRTVTSVIENPPAGSETKKKEREIRSKAMEKSHEGNVDSSDTKAESRAMKVPSKNKDQTETKENAEKSVSATSAIKVENERRHSARLKTKTPTNMELSDLEDDVDLAVEAANVSRKIEEAQIAKAPTDQTLAKLENIEIHLRDEVLPQHKIESRAGSKPLTYAQQKLFQRFAPLSKETYSPIEDEIIRTNWHAFCTDHNWNPKDFKPFLKLKHGDQLIMNGLEQRRLFVQFLANGLPNRPLCSVYSRFKTLFGKQRTSGARYTSEEDMQILAYMLHTPAEKPDKKCSELAKVLDRTRESIWKRYKKLVQKYCEEDKKKVLTKVDWNLSLAEKFIMTLLDVTLSENTMELKDAFIPKVVWLKMEDKMKIDHQLLKRFWEQQLHLQLFAAEPLYLNRIKVMLIEHMYSRQIWHPAEIKWQHIVQYFDGFTISFLRKIFNHLTMKTSAKIRTRNLKKILDWLYTKKIEQLTSDPKDKCLPRIFYKDKKAQIHKEDIAKIRSSSESSDTSESQP